MSPEAAEGIEPARDAPDAAGGLAGVPREGVPHADATEEPEVLSPGDRERWLETFVVCAVVVMPGLFWSFASHFLPPPSPLPFGWTYGLGMVYNAAAAILVLYIIRRSGEPAGFFGAFRPRWKTDLLLAAGIFFLDWGLWVAAVGPVLVAPIVSLESEKELDKLIATLFPRPESVPQGVTLLVACLLIGFSEELIFRGYLLSRWERLLGSEVDALVLTTALFALCHTYLGWSGFAGAASGGLLYGLAFLFFRRLWPVALAHGAWDFFAIVTRA